MNQVYPLHTGFLGWRELPSLAMIMHPVYAYLIVTPAGKTILIDTGNPRSLIGKTRAAPWFDAPLAMNNEDNLIARLSQTGHAIANIDLLVATHFDFNHCGNNDLFDGSRIECLAQQTLLDDARISDRNDRTLWDRPGIRYRALDGETELEKRVTLVETSGHATGHQSVLVEIDGGSLLLTIDAVPEPAALSDGPFPSFYIADESAWRQSRDKLIALAESTGAVMIFGHDPAQADLLPVSGPIRITDALRQSGSPVRSAR